MAELVNGMGQVWWGEGGKVSGVCQGIKEGDCMWLIVGGRDRDGREKGGSDAACDRVGMNRLQESAGVARSFLRRIEGLGTGGMRMKELKEVGG